jgi:hypothetical protein
LAITQSVSLRTPTQCGQQDKGKGPQILLHMDTWARTPETSGSSDPGLLVCSSPLTWWLVVSVSSKSHTASTTTYRLSLRNTSITSADFGDRELPSDLLPAASRGRCMTSRSSMYSIATEEAPSQCCWASLDYDLRNAARLDKSCVFFFVCHLQLFSFSRMGNIWVYLWLRMVSEFFFFFVCNVQNFWYCVSSAVSWASWDGVIQPLYIYLKNYVLLWNYCLYAAIGKVLLKHIFLLVWSFQISELKTNISLGDRLAQNNICTCANKN